MTPSVRHGISNFTPEERDQAALWRGAGHAVRRW